jgi:hypothetical protein
MEALMKRVLAIIAVAILLSMLFGAGHALVRPWPAAHSAVQEAGMIALPASHPDRIRLVYARNGGMVLLREIAVPGPVREVSLSTDGCDIFVLTDDNAYTLSTRTGRIEAQLVAAAEIGKAPAPIVDRSGG